MRHNGYQLGQKGRRCGHDNRPHHPVGNGSCELTLTITTPAGNTISDTVTVSVSDSPYTPITEVELTFDETLYPGAKCEVEKGETPKVAVMYRTDIQLIPKLNDGAKLDNEKIEVTMNDGRLLTVAKKADFKWSSSDESVATVDNTGKVTIIGIGDATILLMINDNGTKFVAKMRVKGWMTCWEALFSILVFPFGGIIMYRPHSQSKLKTYFIALFDSLFHRNHC